MSCRSRIITLNRIITLHVENKRSSSRIIQQQKQIRPVDRTRLKLSPVPYQKNQRYFASEGQIPRQLWQ